MDADQFERRLRELQVMVGSDPAMDLFTQEYESLLNEVNVLPGPRFEKLVRMKKLLMHQAAYLMNEWLREKAGMENNKTGDIVQ